VPASAAEIDELCGRCASWLVLAHHMACRGELLRAHDALAHVQRYLLWIARLVAGPTEHWLTPSRCAECDLPPDLLAELRGTAVREATSTRRAGAPGSAVDGAGSSWHVAMAAWYRSNCSPRSIRRCPSHVAHRVNWTIACSHRAGPGSADPGRQKRAAARAGAWSRVMR
jgi:hypothetical protein